MSSFGSPTCRWLVVVLVLALSLGHACEPAVAEVVAHVHGAAHHPSGHDRDASPGRDHHAPDHDADPAALACDTVVAVAPSAGIVLEPGADLDADVARPVAGTLPWRVAARAARQEPRGIPPGLPLFLLHASFLI